MKYSLSFLTRLRTAKRNGSHNINKAQQPAEVLVYKTQANTRVPSKSQLMYLQKLFSKTERFLFLFCILTILVATLLLGARWYLRSTEIVSAVGGTYTEGMVGAPQYINPVLSSLSDVDADIATLIFPGLFKINDQQQLQPELITNYVVSEDQLTYTFFLRSDVKWHDGERLTADDVLYTIGLIQDPVVQSPLHSSLTEVTAEKIDDYSFSLQLSETFAPFLSSLTFGILPQHIWFAIPAQNIRFTGSNLQPIGAGPFKFASLTKDKSGNIKSFRLIRNDEYYDQKPYINELNFIFYRDIQTAVDALENKKIEGLSFIPKEVKAKIHKERSSILFHSLHLPQYTALFFNQKKSQILRDKAVREAITTAIDKESIVRDILSGEGEPIYTPILPGYVGHNPEVNKHEFDIEKSKQLLQDAGWKYPEGQENTPDHIIPREKDGIKCELNVATADLPEYTETLALLQKNWQTIGIQLNVNTYSTEEIQTKVLKTRDYEALLFGEIIGSDPDPYAFWHSSQQEYPGLALAIFRDKEVDNLLTEARKTNNNDDRRLKYLHFQNNLANELPAAFLYNPLYTYAVHKKVHGINDQQYITVPSDRFSDITQWYIKTKRKFK
ncbi:MAG TPA: ABC transporter substrate-binding protein [Patescibacteria group bacterium]|nr:ABC transporter substrate-binding protein [Patescibacteria group bacterium]